MPLGNCCLLPRAYLKELKGQYLWNKRKYDKLGVGFVFPRLRIDKQTNTYTVRYHWKGNWMSCSYMVTWMCYRRRRRHDGIIIGLMYWKNKQFHCFYTGPARYVIRWSCITLLRWSGISHDFSWIYISWNNIVCHLEIAAYRPGHTWKKEHSKWTNENQGTGG